MILLQRFIVRFHHLPLSIYPYKWNFTDKGREEMSWHSNGNMIWSDAWTENALKQKEKEMPDIAMCPGVNCPKRNECYRYMAISDPIQVYVDFRYDHERRQCDSFIKIESNKRIKVIL
jgi:hypothetical protein